MVPIGFSTGTLAKENFRLGLDRLKGTHAAAIELSALRETELDDLLAALDDLDLERFTYVSFHAPSTLNVFTEEDIVERLMPVLERKWPIVLHPDVITKHALWRRFGEWLCIENMDKRKRVGRTTSELRAVFEELPDASFCFDLAHVRQIDPTMYEARRMLEALGDKIRQIHLSDVNSNCGHERLNYLALSAYHTIAPFLPTDVPVILESPVSEQHIEQEIARAGALFAGR